MSSYDKVMRDAADNEAVTEPTQPAAEHVPMGRFEVTAEAEGDAVVVVEAESEADAERIAYEQHLCGIDIGVGQATWAVTNVREIES